jgi:hypothetical protein
MHPLVAATIANEFAHSRQGAARHARATRRHSARSVLRRVLPAR